MEKFPLDSATSGSENTGNVDYSAFKEARKEQKEQKEWDKKTAELVNKLRNRNLATNPAKEQAPNAKITNAFELRADRIVDELIEHFGASVTGYDEVQKMIAGKEDELRSIQSGKLAGNEVKLSAEIDALIQVKNAMQEKVELEA